jgi:hypothetical protein
MGEQIDCVLICAIIGHEKITENYVGWSQRFIPCNEPHSGECISI